MPQSDSGLVTSTDVEDLPGQDVPHVVVIGGGFAGNAVIEKLKRSRVKITLVDRNVYKVFQPLLYQVASAGLNPGDVTMFLRGVRHDQPNVRYRQGTLISIDQEQRSVTLKHGEVLPYDYLVIASGATTNYMNVEGSWTYAMPMYTQRQAMAIRDKLFEELERTSRDAPDDPLDIVVVGGGPTGVEIAGALADFQHNDVSVLYPELAGGGANLSLVQGGDKLLAGFRDTFRSYAGDELAKRGVALKLGQRVQEVREHSVVLADGSELPADLTIWAAGVTTHPSVAKWGLPQGRGGRIEVDRHLRVDGTENIFAAGDIALSPDELPQLAQPAKQGGQHVAKMIQADLGERSDPRPFRYLDLGIMATIGRRAAVAEIPYFPDFTGTIGWLAWIGVHIRAMLGRRNQLAVLVNLVSLYWSFGTRHQPNPIVGEIQDWALQAAKSERRRRFRRDLAAHERSERMERAWRMSEADRD